MSRRLTLATILVVSSSAYAQPADPPAPAQPADPAVPDPGGPGAAAIGDSPLPPAPPLEPPPTPVPDPAVATTAIAPPDLSDQGIGAEVGIATGAHITPGGLRVSGHYLYQLAAQDWFDGTASFTFGGGTPACFRDRMNAFICEHGLAQGTGVEIGATVRRFLGGKDQFWPFIRAGVGIGIARFTSDSVTGLVVPFHGGAGVRVSVAPGVAVIGEAEVVLGVGLFNHGLGIESQVGVAIAAGAEFRL